MVYVLDTSVVLVSLLNRQFDEFMEETYRLPQNQLVISSVTYGELLSLALKRDWGNKRTEVLLQALENFLVYPVKIKEVLENYARIDAYSQGKLKSLPLPQGITARNMGKNDLWIASTSHTLSGTLLTFDQDFVHLEQEFFGVVTFEISSFL